MGAVRKERCPVIVVYGKVVGAHKKDVFFFLHRCFFSDHRLKIGSLSCLHSRQTELTGEECTISFRPHSQSKMGQGAALVLACCYRVLVRGHTSQFSYMANQTMID